MIFVALRKYANDVYTQIGVVLLIGLSSKTAILIVEFAREIRASGKDIVESALEAARLRFRPLLMTTISFVFGTLPLLFASGAGAASQQAVGTAVFGGMLAATFLTVAFVPVFFRVFQAGGERYLGESAQDGGYEPAGEPAPSLYAKAVDLTLVRPLGLVPIVVSGVGCAMGLPVAWFFQSPVNVDRICWRDPVDYTFTRPLGRF